MAVVIDPAAISASIGPCPAALEPPDELWTQLYSGYQEPKRHYHTFAHVAEVARWYRHVAEERGWDHPREVFLAVLFHDIVYVVGAKDNEARSADRAREAIRTWLAKSGIDSDYTARLIELTARHGSLSPDQVSDEEAHFLDCDMAILGAPPATYEQYERDVALEYQALYPPPLYQQGRAHFLRTLLQHDRIYLSDTFHALLDSDARANLSRALDALA